MNNCVGTGFNGFKFGKAIGHFFLLRSFGVKKKKAGILAALRFFTSW